MTALSFPRLRFSLRTLFVVVTLVSLAAGWLTYRRRDFIARRDYHKGQVVYLSRPVYEVSLIPNRIQLMQHHHQLFTKYQRAAHWPWRPVEPDPPEPTRFDPAS